MGPGGCGPTRCCPWVARTIAHARGCGGGVGGGDPPPLVFDYSKDALGSGQSHAGQVATVSQAG